MKNITKLLSIAAAVATVLASSAHAQTVTVDWGGDYVSANQGFSEGAFSTYRFNDDNVADSTVPVGSTRQRVLFGLSNSTSGYYAPGSYVAPSGKTGNFYLAHNTLFVGGAADPNVFRVTNTGTTDSIRMRTQDTTTTSYVLLGFAKAEFLNGTSSQTLGLDGTTSFNITFGSDVGLAGTSAARYAVLNAGQWYLSNTTFSIAPGSVSLSSSGTETWGLFNPLGTGGGSLLTGTGLNVAPGSYASVTMNDVQGFGLWIGHAGISEALDFEVVSFTASTIPEPSTYALLLIGGASVVYFRRRKMS